MKEKNRCAERENVQHHQKFLYLAYMQRNKEKTRPLADTNKVVRSLNFSPGIIFLDDDAL